MDVVKSDYTISICICSPINVFSFFLSSLPPQQQHMLLLRRDESHIIKRVMNMNVDGHPSRGRPRKRWMDCVKDNMKIKGVSMEMTSGRREWKKKTCCADPK
jgi:hypothetical protein